MDLTGYDAFRHLCRSLGLGRRSLVAMVTGYTAYFDVSRGRDPIYTMAGYIGRVEKWDEFKPPWQKLLADEGLKKPFSPASLESRVGEYHGWSNTKAISFQQRAFQLINKAREVAIGHSISIEAFKTLQFHWVQEPHAESKSHYYHCAACLLRNVQWWINRNRIDEPIEYIFEFGDEGWGDILKLLDEINADPVQRESYRMQGYSRKFKKDVIQLQAAGTWAYESYKRWANILLLHDNVGDELNQALAALEEHNEETRRCSWPHQFPRSGQSDAQA